MKKLLQKLGIETIEDAKRLFWQFFKFGLVGVSSTLISYGVEMLCYYVLFRTVAWPETLRIYITNVIAFVISVINAYYWNNRFVFQSGERQGFKKHVRTFLRVVLCYALTGLLLAPLLKMWISGWGVAYWLTSISTLVVTVPLNFILNKYWGFKR